jgi:DNA-binding NtrC family response regulator
MNSETQTHVWVVDDHDSARESMALTLRHSGHAVTCFSSAIEALSKLELLSPDVILTDLQMPGMSGLEFIRALHERGCESQVVMVTAYASVTTAVEAMRNGAFDYIEKPFNAEQLEQLVARAMNHGTQVGKRSHVPSNDELAVQLIGSSPLMRALRERIQQVANTQETVLITGESGTGKELVARAIHAASPRRSQALVSVNCPALSPQLMESELFGHERGAFTSADTPRVGRFELADGGTLLLDEITEIDLPLQAKLLRVLQEREFERVGSSRTQQVNVRVLAATNRHLLDDVRAGRFRQDLYYRLAVLPLAIPPLRERQADIPELAYHFLHQAAQRLNKAPLELSHSAWTLMQEYNWPGNVRELENVMTRASVLATSNTFTGAELQPWLGVNNEEPIIAFSEAKTLPSGVKLEDMERTTIEAALERFGGHREKTAKALGIGVRTLANKLRQYGYAPRAKVFHKVG